MNELYCICGKHLGHNGFCSKECHDIYFENVGEPKEKNFDLFKIYTRGSEYIEYTGGPTLLKSFKPCKCGGTMKIIPLNHYYIEKRDGYYLIDINPVGKMTITRSPSRVSWSCDSCNIGESFT